MTTPGFTAEAAARTTIGPYRMARVSQGRAIEPARMTPQQCYKRDSNCTQFCGRVKDPDWRHECFSRCNIYLDNCLGRGVWTDQTLTRA